MTARNYKCLSKTEFAIGNFKLIPIRDEDKYAILQWRNEQIDVLRQKELLTKEQQEIYFKNVVDALFTKEKPEQLLFSFLENDKLIGYGGLVHIDWESKNAEVSFLISTERNTNKKLFCSDFNNYLNVLFGVGFDNLQFIKLHTTFYGIEQRKEYKDVLVSAGFKQEAKLEKHLMINNNFVDVFIYSKFREG